MALRNSLELERRRFECPLPFGLGQPCYTRGGGCSLPSWWPSSLLTPSSEGYSNSRRGNGGRRGVDNGSQNDGRRGVDNGSQNGNAGRRGVDTGSQNRRVVTKFFTRGRNTDDDAANRVEATIQSDNDDRLEQRTGGDSGNAPRNSTPDSRNVSGHSDSSIKNIDNIGGEASAVASYALGSVQYDGESTARAELPPKQAHGIGMRPGAQGTPSVSGVVHSGNQAIPNVEQIAGVKELAEEETLEENRSQIEKDKMKEENPAGSLSNTDEQSLSPIQGDSIDLPQERDVPPETCHPSPDAGRSGVQINIAGSSPIATVDAGDEAERRGASAMAAALEIGIPVHWPVPEIADVRINEQEEQEHRHGASAMTAALEAGVQVHWPMPQTSDASISDQEEVTHRNRLAMAESDVGSFSGIGASAWPTSLGKKLADKFVERQIAADASVVESPGNRDRFAEDT